MPVTLSQLAALVEGQLSSSGELPIVGAAPLDQVGPGQVTLVDSQDKAKLLAGTQAAAVVAPLGVTCGELPTIAVADVHRAFIAIIKHFRPQSAPAHVGRSPQAVISPSARLADDVQVYAGATIGDDVEVGPGSVIHSGARVMERCQLAAGVTIYPNAVLYPDTIVGPRVTIHAGVIVGGHGFGYNLVEGRHEPAAQLGHVRIDADVEIGPNSTIDRGTYGATVIGEGTKIDNQVQVAHNCRIGRHNLLCAQVGIAGSTSTGDYVVMAGQAGVRDHVHIGERAVLTAKAGITNNVPAGAVMMGIPATPIRDQRVLQAVLAKLPELRRQVKDLAATVARLSQPAAGTLSPEWLDEPPHNHRAA